MKKVGLFGGTFDPPHIGHLKIAIEAYENLELDELIFIPNHVPAYKMAMHGVSPADDRYGMLKMLVENTPWCKVSTIELEREGNTYTSDTLRELKSKNPDTEYYFIIGSDSLKNMAYWHEPEVIMSLSNIVALIRGEDTKEEEELIARELEEKFGGRVFLVENEKYDISSTDIRNRIKKLYDNGIKMNAEEVESDDVLKWIPVSVYEYIVEHGLYR